MNHLDYPSGSFTKLLSNTYIPKMFAVKQVYQRPKIEIADIPNRINEILSEELFARKIKPGMSIAITAGSRGVANVALITKSIADFIKARGANPFIVPAMGSHGGATAQGQKQVIEAYGITEEYCGCPIRSSMDVVKIGINEEGMDIFIDKNAAEADGIIVSCRIKPHTAFRGPYESGIMKMLTIGLGKQRGAEVCHEAGFKHMAKYVPMFGRGIIKNGNILFAIPTIENAYDETCKIIGVDSMEIESMEPKLLQEAYDYMPKILVDECDVLVVDKIGKNFSGDGMDPNITGTFTTPYANGGIKSQRVAVLDLSKETHRNGHGIGCANVTTKRVFDQLDMVQMYYNAITCTVLGGSNIPVVMENDKEAIQVSIKTCNEIDKRNPRIVRIPNSLQIEYIMLSEVYYSEAKKNPSIQILSEPQFMEFNEMNNLF